MHNCEKRHKCKRQFVGLLLAWLLLSSCQMTLPATTADPSQGWQVAPSVER